MLRKMFAIGTIALGLIGTAFCEDTKKEISAEWDFTKPQAVKAWAGMPKHDMKVMESANSLKLKITGKDPYIVSPGNAGGFAASKFKYISVKMKCSTTEKTYNEVFWIIRTQMTWNGAKHIRASVDAVPNEFKIYNFNMSSQKLWTDIVKRFRLDLFNGAPVDSIIEIEWIKISSEPIS